MDTEFKDEIAERQSSVASSESSSQTSLVCVYDDETQSSILKKKSSSLSCLTDRISDFDPIISTLPSNLSALKPFEETLHAKGALSTQSWYKTAECLEREPWEEELSNIDDQRSLQDKSGNENSDGTPGIINGTHPQVKKEFDLSEVNTVTHTFVRSSALDILAQFPKTETVSAMEDGEKCTTLKALKEDAQEGQDECTDSGTTTCSKSADQLLSSSQPKQAAVSSWSSTGDIKKKQKKKGLFQNNKKAKGVTNLPDSKSTDQMSSQGKPKKDKKKLKFFRAKSTSTEEGAKEMKSKKQQKPLRKSQSFDNNSLPRNSQLNRMNSIRKLFKRPRDSAETEPINNVKCVEISNPILKSDFRSKNLVDREVFLRDRTYQVEKAKVKREKTENECGTVISNARTKNKAGEKEMSLNIDNSKSEHDTVIVNECVESPQNPNSEESPKAPIRFKHLERKRLSMPGFEGLSQEDITEQEKNESNKNDSRNMDQDCGDVEKDEASQVQIMESTPNFSTEKNDLKNFDNPDESEKEADTFTLDQSAVAESTMNDERQTTRQDNDENLNYIFVENVSDKSVMSDTTPTKTGNTMLFPQSLESEFEEVFVDCISDETISLDSATLLVEKPKVLSDTHCSDQTDGARMPTGRWNSSVTSRDSKDAIAKATGIKKKAASFSGDVFLSGKERNSPVKTSPGESSSGTNMAMSPVLGRSQLPRRSSSTFRMPSLKFEAAEPVSLITDMVPVTFPNFLTDRRSQIVLELFTTERTYVRGLETMIELFKKPMLAGKMDERDVDAIFSNLNDIFAVNKDLLFLLWEKVKHWSSEQCIAKLFTDMEERFKIYAEYCKNFDQADSLLKQKIRKNKEFDRFLKTCYQDPLCQPGLDLPAYLITIVQRIPRYLLLLKDLYKKTPSSHPDYNAIQNSLTRMNKVAEYINSQLQEVHGKKAMQELRSTVIGLKAYEVKGRTLLKEAEVCLMSPKRPYKCLLFNDIMVFAVQGSKDRSEIEMTLELRTLWFDDLKKQDPQTTKCDAIELYTPHRPYTMYACSRTDKRIWIQKLRTAIVTLLYGPDCDDPDAMDISKRKASDTYFDGSVYCGEYVNGKRHGHGVMAWPNRTRYEGSWADDEREGRGRLTYYTGEKYEGNWVADKKEGKGRQTYVNNDVYDGQWRDGKMHGMGVINFANTDRYVGEMCNNEVEGTGEMTCSSGLIYKGQWKNSKRNGQGHMFMPNGNEYQGEFLNDRICGFGRMKYFNGDEYTGEWVNELRHGSGYLKLVNGTVYDGQWNNDFMNGQGKMTYPNGDEYTGTWYKNKRVGKGQLMYAHGDTYNGQWQSDTMQGKGTMYYKDGSVYEGEWENGLPGGHGKTVFKDKRIYEGEYYLGFRHGRGQLIYPNNVLYVGEWKFDKFDGNGVFNDPNTDYSYQGDWSCGMREGSGIEISYRTRYDGSWKTDMKHGQGEEKSHAGHVFRGTWKDNRKHGEGIRKLRSSVEEVQHWHEGHLMDGGETVAEGLPPLPRR